jgi:hypothetical protein
MKLGITELDIKGYTPVAQDPVNTNNVIILGAGTDTSTEYTVINLADLINKQGQH